MFTFLKSPRNGLLVYVWVRGGGRRPYFFGNQGEVGHLQDFKAVCAEYTGRELGSLVFRALHHGVTSKHLDFQNQHIETHQFTLGIFPQRNDMFQKLSSQGKYTAN